MNEREDEVKKIKSLDFALKSLSPTYNVDSRDTMAIHSKLPSNEEVTMLCIKLEEIIFPGYRTRVLNGSTRFNALIRVTLDEIYDILYDQICKSLPFRWIGECAKKNKLLPTNEIKREAGFIVDTVLSKLPTVRELIKKDVLAAYNGDPAAMSYAEIILSYPCMKAIAIYRFAHELYILDVPLIPRMMTEYAHSETGIDIHPGARIGESFFIDHGTGVVIGETCQIGDRVKIYQGVTLGAKSFPLDADGHPIKGIKRHPDIEDDVIIYSGATILGGDTVIGKGSVIGGNVWLIGSVPPYSVVVQKHLEVEIKNANRKERIA